MNEDKKHIYPLPHNIVIIFISQNATQLLMMRRLRIECAKESLNLVIKGITWIMNWIIKPERCGRLESLFIVVYNNLWSETTQSWWDQFYVHVWLARKPVWTFCKLKLLSLACWLWQEISGISFRYSSLLASQKSEILNAVERTGYGISGSSMRGCRMTWLV